MMGPGITSDHAPPAASHGGEITVDPWLATAGAVVYASGAAIWTAMWFGFGFFTDALSDPLLVVGWLGGTAVLVANGAIVWVWPTVNKDYKVETYTIEFVERHASYLVAAIGSTIVAVALYVTAVHFTIPTLSIDFTVGSLATAVGAVFPLVWIPSERNSGLALLRHIKTVPFTFSVFMFLSSVIAIYHAIA